MKSTWIVAYDISRDRDREQAAASLLSRGARLQRSVFQVVTDDAPALLTELSDLIEVNNDVVQAFRQCESCAQEELGHGQCVPGMRTAWWVA